MLKYQPIGEWYSGNILRWGCSVASSILASPTENESAKVAYNTFSGNYLIKLPVKFYCAKHTQLTIVDFLR